MRSRPAKPSEGSLKRSETSLTSISVSFEPSTVATDPRRSSSSLIRPSVETCTGSFSSKAVPMPNVDHAQLKFQTVHATDEARVESWHERSVGR